MGQGRKHCLKLCFSHLSDLTILYACFLVKETALIMKILFKQIQRLFPHYSGPNSTYRWFDSEPKRCSLVMRLWKLGIGSVHSLCNLWEKHVLATTTGRQKSFLFPVSFSVELEFSFIYLLFKRYCAIGLVSTHTPFQEESNSIKFIYSMVAMEKQERRRDNAGGRVRLHLSFSWPHSGLQSWIPTVSFAL